MEIQNLAKCLYIPEHVECFSLLLNFVEVSLAKHFCSNQQIFKLSAQSEKKCIFFAPGGRYRSYFFNLVPIGM